MRLKRPSQTSLRRFAELGLEPLRIGREMVAIPLELWLAIAELAGLAVLAAWRRLWRLLIALGRGALALLRVAEREVTGARSLVAVALAAAIALGASQWADYHEVSVGTGQYSGVEGIAPPPDVERERAGDAHLWVMLPLAAAAVVATGLAALGNRRAPFALVGLGVAALAIAIIVDVPQGLDEGAAAVAYEGARASLLEGFWVQIAAAAVLCACGGLLAIAVRGADAGLKSRRRTPDRNHEGMKIAEATRT